MAVCQLLHPDHHIWMMMAGWQSTMETMMWALVVVVYWLYVQSNSVLPVDYSLALHPDRQLHAAQSVMHLHAHTDLMSCSPLLYRWHYQVPYDNRHRHHQLVFVASSVSNQCVLHLRLFSVEVILLEYRLVIVVDEDAEDQSVLVLASQHRESSESIDAVAFHSIFAAMVEAEVKVAAVRTKQQRRQRLVTMLLFAAENNHHTVAI
jgi:hypothetical protein